MTDHWQGWKKMTIVDEDRRGSPEQLGHYQYLDLSSDRRSGPRVDLNGSGTVLCDNKLRSPRLSMIQLKLFHPNGAWAHISRGVQSADLAVHSFDVSRSVHVLARQTVPRG